MDSPVKNIERNTKHERKNAQPLSKTAKKKKRQHIE